MLIFIFSWVFITLCFDASLSYGMFSPLFPDLSTAREGLSEILTKYADANMLKSIVRSLFAGASIYYVLSVYAKYLFKAKD